MQRHVEVSIGDRARCADGVWFNDAILEFYLRWLLDESPPPLEPQHHFHTQFYSTLIEGGHRAVRRWTRRVDLFRQSLITIPINVANTHWSLIAIANLDMIETVNIKVGKFVPCIFNIDPLGTHEHSVVRKIRAYLHDEWIAKRGDSPCPVNLKQLRVDFPAATLQNNGDDCGVYSGVEYRSSAINAGRLFPGCGTFIMDDDGATAVDLRGGELSRKKIVAHRTQIRDLMTAFGQEYHAIHHVAPAMTPAVPTTTPSTAPMVVPTTVPSTVPTTTPSTPVPAAAQGAGEEKHGSSEPIADPGASDAATGDATDGDTIDPGVWVSSLLGTQLPRIGFCPGQF